MTKLRTQYPILVRADLLERDPSATASIASQVSETIRRHLTRIELAAQSYRGKVVRRTAQGITACFSTAESAVLGAREMHRRCSGIRQTSGSRIGVQIGIHSDTAADDINAIELTATRLATLLGEGGMVISGAIVDALTPELRQKVLSVVHPKAWIPAHTINWEGSEAALSPNCQIAPEGVINSPVPCIVLRLGGREYVFGNEKPLIAVGRDPTSDIVINDPKASRRHFRIINQRDRCVVVDQSRNGTYITPSEGEVMMVKHEMAGLRGKGWITLGHPYERNDRYVIEFEVIGSKP